MARRPPEKFGKCRLLKRLGEGATAVVFLGKHEALDVPVAVKILRPSLSSNHPEYAARFLREARTAARLSHSNIIRVSDCGVAKGYHYMIMDYVDGVNCDEKIEEAGGTIEWREATRIVREVSNGLKYAAEHGIIHRDIKPSNILLDRSGRPYIADLGLAKLTIKGMAALTQELHTVGTPDYMSPEQISSPDDLDLRSDIYSLGATFYHFVCGRTPFSGQNTMKVVAQHLTAPLVPPIERNPEVTPAVSAIICKMMAKLPDERYQSYEDLCKDLDNLLVGREVAAVGFSASTSFAVNDEELEQVLAELDFGPSLEIEDGLQQGPSGALAGEQESEAGGSQHVAPAVFDDEALAAYSAPGNSGVTASRRRAKREQAHKNVIIAVVAAAVVVLILLIGLVIFFWSRAAPSQPAGPETTQSNSPAGP